MKLRNSLWMEGINFPYLSTVLDDIGVIGSQLLPRGSSWIKRRERKKWEWKRGL